MKRLIVVVEDKDVGTMVGSINLTIVKNMTIEDVVEVNPPQAKKKSPYKYRAGPGKTMNHFLSELLQVGQSKGLDWFIEQTERKGYARGSASSALSELVANGFFERSIERNNGEYKKIKEIPAGFKFKRKDKTNAPASV